MSGYDLSNRPEIVESGEPARLIPIAADSNKEQRLTSVVLAAMCGVFEFRKAVLESIDRNVSKRAKLSAWTEVTLADGTKAKEKKAKKDRPDGLLVLKSGKSIWRALIEAKVGNAEVSDVQLQGYLQLAKQRNVDAVITITNQLVAHPSHTPVALSKRPPKDVGLYHWSWTSLLTQASLLLDGEEVESLDQLFILEEMVRYLTDAPGGMSRFNRMNSEWKDIVGKVRLNSTLRQNSDEVENTVSSWHQEQRDLSLLMSRKLGRSIKLILKKAYRKSPHQRLRDDSKALAENKTLTCTLRIPHAAADLNIKADLATRTIVCSMGLNAPQNKQSEKAKVNWLRRQLSNVEPEGFYIKAIRPRRAENTQASLAEVLENPNALSSNSTDVKLTAFEIFYMKDLAGGFSGSRVFIEELEQTVPHFYEQVGQHLRAYAEPPPKIVDSEPASSENTQEESWPEEVKSFSSPE